MASLAKDAVACQNTVCDIESGERAEAVRTGASMPKDATACQNSDGDIKSGERPEAVRTCASSTKSAAACQNTASDSGLTECSEPIRARASTNFSMISMPRCSRSDIVFAVTREVTERTSASASSGTRMTPAISALIITSCLFTFITIAQIIGAQIAHSKALLMDCISMGVDALTYMGNIVVECRKRDGAPHNCSQLVVCAFSLSLLLFFTFDASRESYATAQMCWRATASSEDGDDVNGWITFAYGAGGVIFDIISLWAFHRSSRKEGQSVNMFTAFLHVAADFLRSGATVTMSLLILLGGFDSTCLDAYTSLLIGASIACGGFVGVLNWMKLFYHHFCGVNA